MKHSTIPLIELYSVHSTPCLTMQFSVISNILFLTICALCSVASPTPMPEPIESILQPVVTTKNNLAGSQLFADPPSKQTSNADPKDTVTSVSFVTITGGILLASLL
ncbi:hypothetical protein BDZ94DRAFT_883594 [Collybia nuda]|uniref:Uncharacterized protein n=1 Tax=Collybia nuda TaxID=64659 RepID=A0A9P5Y1U4_9AGAR|nr:hypothetical protein BDZ94DRAFT_883594 [Collybia nuda]